MNNKYNKILFAALVVLAMGGSFVGGWLYGQQPAASSGNLASLVGVGNCPGGSCGLQNMAVVSNIINASSGQPNDVDFSAFWKTWLILNEKFVDGNSLMATSSKSSTTPLKVATAQDRVWGAISGMVNSLGDPYTVFMPPQENKQFAETIQGNFSGIGMEVGYKDNIPTVITPLPNSPAKLAGIQTGDRVIKIDGVSTLNLPLDDAISHIRGKEGTTVTLTIQRGKEKTTRDITLTRKVIDIPTTDKKIIEGATPADRVYVIDLYNFSAPSADLFRQSIKNFTSSGSHKLVLDLRGNPGGYLEAAVDIASWFLPKDSLVVRESHGKDQSSTDYKSAGYNIFANDPNFKMAILVDGGSASASEILAGALSEHGVAKLVGAKTFGKGSVQELIPITDNSSLKVTIARWFTPNGRSISQNGLDPDITVPMSDTDVLNGKDPQLDRAVQYLRTGK